MRLTRYTDYAVRMLFFLGVNPGRAVPISQVAKTYGISQNHLVKVAHDLVSAGYLTSVRGRSGGVMLARAPQDILIGQLVRHTEPDMQLVDCSSCVIAPACALPTPLQAATRAFIETLDRYSLADIMHASQGLDAILAPLDAP